jgi:hypothetical protein
VKGLWKFKGAKAAAPIRGKGYEGVPATGAGVMPPRIVLPDSVDVEVKVEEVSGVVKAEAPSSRMGENRALSKVFTRPRAESSRRSRSRASFSR